MSSVNQRRLDLYRCMQRIRTFEEEVAAHYAEQEMRCPTHLCIGQEASEAGTGLALLKTDYVLSGHRAHGHYIAKGGNLKRMLAEIYGKETGCVGGKGGSMHLLDLEAGFLGCVPIVGSTIPIAVGAAFASRMRGEDRVTMVFFGDGAVEAGVLHESLNFAALKRLPIVFVCENNLYSVYSPLSVRQPEGRPITDLARGHGIEAVSLDGNDADTVFEAASRAVADARAGRGPVFLELATYRWREHCGPNYDNDIGYRTEDEYLIQRERDPVAMCRLHLERDDVASAVQLQEIDSEIRGEIEEAFEFAAASPFPSHRRGEDEVYA